MLNTQSEDCEQPQSSVSNTQKKVQLFSLFDLSVGIVVFVVLFFQQCMLEVLFPIGTIFILNGIFFKCSRKLDQFMIGIFNIMQLFAVWALATNEYEECKIGYVLVVIYVIVIFCFITSSMIILI